MLLSERKVFGGRAEWGRHCRVVEEVEPPVARPIFTVLKFLVSSFWFLVSSFGFRDSGFGFRVPSFGFRVSGFGIRDSGFGIRVLGYGCTHRRSRPEDSLFCVEDSLIGSRGFTV